MIKWIKFCLIALCLIGASCRQIPQDRGLYAAEAGESTIALGSCLSEFNKGWGQCLIEKRDDLRLPVLRFVTTNAAEWAVGDCELGVYRTGATTQAGLVEVDLAGLNDQIRKNRMCILKIETLERYRDPTDHNQLHPIYMRGGLFIELIESGYTPTPSQDVLAFCVRVERTTRGRTNVTNCAH